MTVVVSVASGKGGVGKSTVATNLAVLAAQRGYRTALIDLDVGGADAHLLLGELSPKRGLSEFLFNGVDSLDEVAVPVAGAPGLRLVAGTGDTLKTVNPTWAAKRRLARHLRKLPEELVFLDVGAGSGLHCLDFFLMADRPVLVSTPEPTAIMDVYKFVKLAAVRHVLSHFVARDAVSVELAGQDVQSLAELIQRAKQVDPEAEETVRDLVAAFQVSLLVNQVASNSRLDTLRLAGVIREFVGSQLQVLGQIPRDEAVVRAVAKMTPLVRTTPHAPASLALGSILDALLADGLGRRSPLKAG